MDHEEERKNQEASTILLESIHWPDHKNRETDVWPVRKAVDGFKEWLSEASWSAIPFSFCFFLLAQFYIIDRLGQEERNVERKVTACVRQHWASHQE